MDERIEAFLRDVLALEGEIWNLLREGVRRHLAICEEQFRDAETNKRMKDRAAQACRKCSSHKSHKIASSHSTPPEVSGQGTVSVQVSILKRL